MSKRSVATRLAALERRTASWGRCPQCGGKVVHDIAQLVVVCEGGTEVRLCRCNWLGRLLAEVAE